MALLLKGTAFITGAASGIGQHTAYALARHGITKLALADRNACTETISQLRSSSNGNSPLSIQEYTLDVSSEADVDRVVEDAAKRFGRIDVAVNNAGVGGKLVKCQDVEKEDWDRVVGINLTGVWLCQRAQLRLMMRQENLSPRLGRGTIINVASMLGLISPSASTPSDAYAATKHGVMGLTKSSAVQYARDGIRINALCPGYVATPLLQSSAASDVMHEEIEKTPMGRLAGMEEIADCVVFLGSEMSSFVTAAGLVSDGGFTAH